MLNQSLLQWKLLSNLGLGQIEMNSHQRRTLNRMLKQAGISQERRFDWSMAWSCVGVAISVMVYLLAKTPVVIVFCLLLLFASLLHLGLRFLSWYSHDSIQQKKILLPTILIMGTATAALGFAVWPHQPLKQRVLRLADGIQAFAVERDNVLKNMHLVTPPKANFPIELYPRPEDDPDRQKRIQFFLESQRQFDLKFGRELTAVIAELGAKGYVDSSQLQYPGTWNSNLGPVFDPSSIARNIRDTALKIPE